jgi:hypothetical protein
MHPRPWECPLNVSPEASTERWAADRPAGTDMVLDTTNSEN